MGSNVINEESGKIDNNKNTFFVEGVNWILGEAPQPLKNYFQQSKHLTREENDNKIHDNSKEMRKGLQMEVQIRHGARSFMNAHVEPLSSECTILKVTLGTKEAIAAGQYAAFYNAYNKDQCFGAGVISEDSWKSSVEHTPSNSKGHFIDTM